MIRVQPLEGVWQTLGADLYQGVEPEGVTPAWGPNGPESLSFSLQRPPNRVHADLLPFTPVEWYPSMDASGDPLWSGYTMQAPPGGYGESTSVSCVGWHYYREDMPAPAFYVRDGVDGFTDTRGIPEENLVVHIQAGQVTVGDGQIVLGFPNTTPIVNPRRAAVVFDAGYGNGVQAGSVKYASHATADANWFFQVLLSDYPYVSNLPAGSYEATALIQHSVSPTGTLTFTGTSKHRYVVIYAEHRYTGTTTFDVFWRFTRVTLGASPAYIDATTGDSLFRADQGIIDTTQRLCPQLSQDFSRVTVPTFKIPSAAWTDDTTARQQQDSFNDYHGYALGVDAQRRVFFRPQPSVPRLQVDALTPGVSYRATSTNDGSEVYNHVSVRGKSGSGEDLRLDRFLSEAIDASQAVPSVLGPVNPNFDSSATGWTGATRVTTDFVTSPACGEGAAPVASFTGGTFLAGVLYQVKYWLRTNWDPPVAFAGIPGAGDHVARFGSSTDYADKLGYSTGATFGGYGAWVEWTINWTPKADVSASSVTLQPAQKVVEEVTVAGDYIGSRVDAVRLYEIPGGILTKRRRVRSFTLNVAAATDQVAMTALADAWLLAHRTVPHKATLTIGADDVVTDLQAGQVVPMGGLGRYYGEMVRVLSVPDPDTGALQSRDGVVASVQGAGPVSLALDSERRSLEALMSRMGVVQG